MQDSSDFEKLKIVRKRHDHSQRGVVLRTRGPHHVEVRWFNRNEITDCHVAALEASDMEFGDRVWVTDLPAEREGYVCGHGDDGSLWIHLRVKRSQVRVRMPS